MKRIIIFIVTLMGACCRLAVAQESPPPSQYLKSVNAQFYIDSRDSSVWHFKGATYGWEKLGRYKDISAKLNISDTTFLLKKTDAANIYGKLTGTNHFSGLNYFNNGNSQMLIDGASMSGNLGRVVFGGTSPFVQTYAGLPFIVKSGSGSGGIIAQNDSIQDSQGKQFLKDDGSGNLNLTGRTIKAQRIESNVIVSGNTSTGHAYAQMDSFGKIVAGSENGESLSLWNGSGGRPWISWGLGGGGYRGNLRAGNVTSDRNWEMPNASGTLALTSDLSNYLPVSGGTLTGNIDLGGNYMVTAASNRKSYFSSDHIGIERTDGPGLGLYSAIEPQDIRVWDRTNPAHAYYGGLQRDKVYFGDNDGGDGSQSIVSARSNGALAPGAQNFHLPNKPAGNYTLLTTSDGNINAGDGYFQGNLTTKDNGSGPLSLTGNAISHAKGTSLNFGYSLGWYGRYDSGFIVLDETTGSRNTNVKSTGVIFGGYGTGYATAITASTPTANQVLTAADESGTIATREYAATTYLPLAGGNITGNLSIYNSSIKNRQLGGYFDSGFFVRDASTHKLIQLDENAIYFSKNWQAGDYFGKLQTTTLTNSRTWDLPDESGTVATREYISANYAVAGDYVKNTGNAVDVNLGSKNLNANDIQAAGLLVTHYNGTTSIAGNGIFSGSNSLNFDGDGSWRFTAPVKLPSAYPTDPLHAAPKAYVDNAITGLFWKNAVRVRTTGNITLSGLQTIDGQTGGTYRVLVNAQTNPAENGIYDQKSGAWTRAADADTGDEIWGSTVMVANGTLYRNTQWTNINTASPTPGTDPVTYGQISGAGTYAASSGVLLSANVFTLDQSFTRGLFSITGPLTYNNATGVFGINQASGSQDGYLSASNWTTFNNKQNAITLTSGQVGYSDGSTIVGTSNLVWDNTNGTLKLGAGTADANAILKVTAASGSKGVVVGTSAYPSWMGTNGLYVDGGFRANSYFINSGGGLNFGGSGARIVGVNINVGQDSYLGFYTGGGAPFATNGERMRIIDDGKVGIGIATPQAIIHTASGASAQNTIGAMLQNSGGTAANTSVSLDFTNTTATTGQIAQGRIASIRTNRVASGDADLAFYTLSNNNLLERLRITNGNFGFLTSDPTHTITLGSASTGLAFYRTANQTTDFERVLMSWNGTTFQIQSDNLGTGVTRNLAFGAGASLMTFSSTGINNAAVEFKRDNSAISNIVSVNSAGLTGTSVQSALSIYPTINQNNAAAGGYNGLFISPFEQSLGTGTKYLINAGVNNAANGTGVHDLKFGVDNVGQIITSSTGSHIFNNTANGTANYERGLIQWQSNSLTVGTYYGGTGAQRSLQIGVQQSPGATSLANGRILTINPNPSSTAGMFDFTAGTTGTGNMTSFRSSLFGTSGTQNEMAALTTINQSGTAGYNISYINVTETSTGSGAKMLARWEVGGSGKFSVDNNGNTQITGAITSAGRRANVTAVKTANYSATFSDEIIQCNSSTGSFNVTLLPSAPIGTIITIDNVDGTANSVTVLGTINGTTNYTLNALKTVTLYKTATGTNTWKFYSNIN